MKILKKAIILAFIITALVLIFTLSASAAGKFLDIFTSGLNYIADSASRFVSTNVNNIISSFDPIDMSAWFYNWKEAEPTNFTQNVMWVSNSVLSDIQLKLIESGIATDLTYAVDYASGNKALVLRFKSFYKPNSQAGQAYEPYVGYYLCFNGNYLLGLIDDSSAVTTGRNQYVEPGGIGGDNYGDIIHDESTTVTVLNQNKTSTENNYFISQDFSQYFDVKTGDSYEIDNWSYDAGDQTYNVSYREGDTINNVSITYHVQYTIIEYVGLDETYISYYELPDGRSSADQTVEDLEFLATGYDIVNYGVESDDIRLRALYHFDGNTADDSYFGFMSDFEWILNPSITYLDAYEWGGCLYLDDLAHQFKITLPSTINTTDFSVMWRMYTGYSDTSTVLSSGSYVGLGERNFLYWNETSLGYKNGTVIADLPIGSWCEIAVVRNNGTFYYYVNGLCVNSYTFSIDVGSEIVFYFSGLTKNTEYLDELRVFNYAVAEAGLSYNPITSPQDTNLVLVLPDPGEVVIDNYWSFDESVNLAQNSQYPFDGKTFNFQDHTSDYVLPTLNGITAEAVDDFVRFTSFQTTDAIKNIGSNTWFSGAGIEYEENAYAQDNVLGCIVNSSNFSQYLTFTVCLADGRMYSISRNRNGGYINGTQFGGSLYDYISYYYDCGDFYITSSCSDNHSGRPEIFFSIYIKPGKSVDLSYYEVTQGTTPSSSLKYESFIYDLGSLTAPTIAVRSRVPVTDYRIGGVRPTIAEKGMVWMQVENQRITNCLIHDGYGWVQVDIRIWTGSRWAPPSAYDVFTMQDLWDVVGTTDGVLIVDDQGFWYWFVGAWDDLKSWFEQLIDSINALDLSVTIDPDNDVVINVEHDINQWFGDDINDPDIPDNGNSLFDWIKDVFNINAKFKVTIFGDKDAAYQPAWDLLDMFSNTGSPIFGLNNAGDDFWEFDGGGNSAG